MRKLKNILTLTAIAIFSTAILGQNSVKSTFHNPSLKNGKVEIDKENKALEVSFDFVETSDYKVDKEPITISLCLLNVSSEKVKVDTDSEVFQWTHLQKQNCLVAKQVNEILANRVLSFSVTAPLKEFVDDEQSVIVGFNANIQPASLMNGQNKILDDNLSDFISLSRADLVNLQEVFTITPIPSPTTDFITLNFEEAVEDGRIEVYNSSGELIKNILFQGVNSYNLLLNNLETTDYFTVKVINGDHVDVKKILLNK